MQLPREYFLEYGKEIGYEGAVGILLLGGPDEFEGDYAEYNSLLKELERRAEVEERSRNGKV